MAVLNVHNIVAFAIYSLMCGALSNLAFLITRKLHGFVGKRTTESSLLRQGIQSLTADLNQISMTDEFAAYTRKNRQLFKLKARLQSLEMSSSMDSFKVGFFLNIFVYGLIAVMGALIVYVNYGRTIMTLPASWLTPLNILLAVPDLKATYDDRSETPVSGSFLFFILSTYGHLLTKRFRG